MPGPVVYHYLSTCREDRFMAIAQVFRHDVVLYSGMLLSWAALFESEISPEVSDAFQYQTRMLQQITQNFHDEAKSRLYPEPPPADTTTPYIEALCIAWDTFHADFVRFARPQLDAMRTFLENYITDPEFASVIQHNLGAAANDEAIGQLLMQAHRKMYTLLDAARFDERVGIALYKSNSDT